MKWFRKRECVNAPFCDNPSGKCSRDIKGCAHSAQKLLTYVLRNRGLPEDMTMEQFRKKVDYSKYADGCPNCGGKVLMPLEGPHHRLTRCLNSNVYPLLCRFKPKEDKEMKCNLCECIIDSDFVKVNNITEPYICMACKERFARCKRKCKGCDIEIDVKLTYCVSCAGGKKECGRCHGDISGPSDYCVDCVTYLAAYNACPDCGIDKSRGIRKCWDCHDKSKEEPKMKEFDLRPFEVKKPQRVITQYFLEYQSVYTKEWIRFNNIAYPSSKEAAIDLIKILEVNGAVKVNPWQINCIRKDDPLE